jgi:hypothetical protein
MVFPKKWRQRKRGKPWPRPNLIREIWEIPQSMKKMMWEENLVRIQRSSERKRKKSDSETGEAATNIPKMVDELHQEENAELEKTHELRVKDKNKTITLERKQEIY